MSFLGLLKLLLDVFLKLFSGKKPDSVLITIPHPEEPPDYEATADIDHLPVISDWLLYWQVPAEYWLYWQSAIDVQVYETYPDYMIAWGVSPDAPAFAWEQNGKRHIAIKPAFLNKGVIAHEQAHNSYALLTEEQKSEFSTAYTPLKTTDPFIKYLYSINPYGLTSDIEAHAEIYRYLQGEIPVELLKYYPKLIEEEVDYVWL